MNGARLSTEKASLLIKNWKLRLCFIIVSGVKSQCIESDSQRSFMYIGSRVSTSMLCFSPFRNVVFPLPDGPMTALSLPEGKYPAIQ